ncbi:MAG: DUF885 family protein [Clostridia bacterium]|nr:DUF885 family protein [Clostridia bacterium]
MKQTTRIIAILLAAVMLLGLAGCGRCGKNNPEIASPPPVAENTDRPVETDAPVVTAKPTSVPVEKTEEQKAAEAAFWALDEELFVAYVTQDITSLDQYCENPASFGIDESTVPVTLGEFNEKSDNEWIDRCAVWREKLLAIDRGLLSDQLQFAYDNYLRYFDMQIESKGLFYCYEPLDEIVGLHLNMPMFFGLYSFKDQQDIDNYLKLMEDMPRFFGEVLAMEQERANRGLFMTEEMLDEILSDLEKIAESGETSFIHGTFREAMEEQDYLSDEQREAYIAKNDELVRTVFVGAYQQLHDGLEKLRPQCRARIGSYEQGGDAYRYFCWKVRDDVSNNRTVDEEIEFLEGCLNDMMYEMIAAYRSYGRDDYRERKITTGSLEGDEAYLKTLMPQIVPPMPDVEVTYKDVPKELQDSFSPAAYSAPALDGFLHNVILINPKSQDSYDMSTLAHEGFPGHMYQFTYQYSLGTIPKFQCVIETVGYAESWSTNMEWNIAQIHTKYNSDLAQLNFLDEYYTTLIIMIVSLKVNGQGATLEDITNYCLQQGFGETAGKFLYDYAIDLPVYVFKYAGGFAELYDMTNRLCKKDKVSFFGEYLHWGPGYFDLLNERMEAWANAQ